MFIIILIYIFLFISINIFLYLYYKYNIFPKLISKIFYYNYKLLIRNINMAKLIKCIIYRVNNFLIKYNLISQIIVNFIVSVIFFLIYSNYNIIFAEDIYEYREYIRNCDYIKNKLDRNHISHPAIVFDSCEICLRRQRITNQWLKLASFNELLSINGYRGFHPVNPVNNNYLYYPINSKDLYNINININKGILVKIPYFPILPKIYENKTHFTYYEQIILELWKDGLSSKIHTLPEDKQRLAIINLLQGNDKYLMLEKKQYVLKKMIYFCKISSCNDSLTYEKRKVFVLLVAGIIVRGEKKINDVNFYNLMVNHGLKDLE